MGDELSKLINLKSIFVNVYLTDTKYLSVGEPAGEDAVPTVLPPAPPPPATALDTKQAHISDNEPTTTPAIAEAEGQRPEAQAHTSTQSQDRKETSEAETSAANTMFCCHKSLRHIGFISYWSPDHLGWTIYEPNGKDVLHSTPLFPSSYPNASASEDFRATESKGGGKT